jgi:hypothetical protein
MGRPGYLTKYDFIVLGTFVRVFRMDKLLAVKFSTEEKDTKDLESPLRKFLEGIGQSRVDAHTVCEAVEKGGSVRAVFGRH